MFLSESEKGLIVRFKGLIANGKSSLMKYDFLPSRVVVRCRSLSTSFSFFRHSKLHKRSYITTNTKYQNFQDDQMEPRDVFKAFFNPNVDHLRVEKCIEKAAKHIHSIFEISLNVDLGSEGGRQLLKNVQIPKIMVVYDVNSLLSRVLAVAYGRVLEKKEGVSMMNFDDVSAESLIDMFGGFGEGDLVVCVQSSSFRLNDYRLRLELFKKGIKVIEHVHLNLIKEMDEVETYVDSLYLVPSDVVKRVAYDIKKRLDECRKVVVGSKGGYECVYDCMMEECLLNIGDYEGMKNVGGTYPIGEVFTEPRDLSRVNGEMLIFAYPDKDHVLNHLDDLFKIRIEQGKLVWVDENAPKNFLEVLNVIRAAESEDDDGSILVREFGVGLNEKIGKSRPLSNAMAFERQAGFHISLGRKHTVFKKKGISHKKSRFHVDLFVDLDYIDVDGHRIFSDGKLNISSPSL